LRRLIRVPVETFAEEHWGSRPLLSPSADLPAGFADLFSLGAVDELLAWRGLRTPFVRVVKGGNVVEPRRYTGSGGVGAEIADQVVDDRVLELFADGHTIVLQGLHRLWPPLIEFAGELTADLGHPVQINAYITPSASQGFSAHYDVHDVFVLQVAGDKRWTIHDPVHLDPLRTQSWNDHAAAVAQRAEEHPALDTVLHADDALYLPRGVIHSAEALGEVSAHLTVGVQEHTRHAIVEAIAAIAADDLELRRSLPLGIDVRNPDELDAEVEATVEALSARLETISSRDVARIMAERTRSSTRPAPLGPVAQLRALERLDVRSTICARRNLHLSVTDRADEIEISGVGRPLKVAAAAKAALDTVLRGQPVQIDDLPGLSAEAALELARELVRCGIVLPDQAG
jgi:lysine-specific demethylase/histidyl-hydroxylase NO66